MSKYKMKFVNDEDEANKALDDMEQQGYEPVKFNYDMSSDGHDCYEGVVIMFRKT